MKKFLSSNLFQIVSFVLGAAACFFAWWIGYCAGQNHFEVKAVNEGAAEYYLDNNYEKKFRFKPRPSPEVWVSPTTPESSWKPQPKKGLHRDNPNTTSLRGLRLFPKAETVPHEGMPEVRGG